MTTLPGDVRPMCYHDGPDQPPHC